MIDRISGADRPRKINAHRWIGVQRLYALAEWTRAQIAAEFGITGNPDEERQATQIATAIDGAGNATNKMIYIGRVEAILYCLEDANDRLYHDAGGAVNKTKVFEDMQIVG